MMEFEWDSEKSRENESKHYISFEQAAEALSGFVLERQDDRFDYGEDRWIGLALSGPTVLVIAYTLRGDRIRIISARKATPKERRIYYEAEERRHRSERHSGDG